MDIENIYKFDKNLKELMQEQNLSQNKLAKETGLKQSVIARWLSNKQKPSADALIILALYFKCSIDYLVGLED